MSFWTFVFLAMIAGMAFSVWRSKHLARHGMYQDKGGDVRPFEGSARETALQHEVEELRERIKVLERIATDDRGAGRLAAEIDALRDVSKIEERSKP